jgi:hypothetical protein
MKGAVFTLLGAVALMGGLIALFSWSPWDSEQREREFAWVEALARWGESAPPASCEARFEADVGGAPTTRLQAVASMARTRCDELEEPRFLRWEVAGVLIDGHRKDAVTTHEPDLSGIAAGIAGRGARIHCWSEGDWTPMAEQYSLLNSGEFWPAGLATPARSLIDLAPEVCDPLRRFVREGYAPWLSTETYDLSLALATLTHEAEHLRVPFASEAEVECYALQRVRALVRQAGKGRRYQDEMALIAWELGYPYLPPEYQTRRCRNGGPLDLRPGSSEWP